jgi:hypothetical protein
MVSNNQLVQYKCKDEILVKIELLSLPEKSRVHSNRDKDGKSSKKGTPRQSREMYK